MNTYPRIKGLREDKDISQKDMARALKISRRTYAHYEDGDRDIPTEVLVEIALFHNTSMEYLVSLIPNKSPNYDKQDRLQYKAGRHSRGEK